eukprot:11373834-Alexandrium_andersonii.AAC.1
MDRARAGTRNLPSRRSSTTPGATPPRSSSRARKTRLMSSKGKAGLAAMQATDVAMPSPANLEPWARDLEKSSRWSGLTSEETTSRKLFLNIPSDSLTLAFTRKGPE